MRGRINALPFPLALVAWANIGWVLLTPLVIVFLLWQRNLRSSVWVPFGFVEIGLALLTIGGILEKSRFVRKYILRAKWLYVSCSLILTVVELSWGELTALIALLPAAIGGVTLWGLMSNEAAEYFDE